MSKGRKVGNSIEMDECRGTVAASRASSMNQKLEEVEDRASEAEGIDGSPCHGVGEVTWRLLGSYGRICYMSQRHSFRAYVKVGLAGRRVRSYGIYLVVH